MVGEAPEIPAERIGKIRETREKVVAGLPEEEKGDRGRIRFAVSQTLREEDKALSPEERRKIAERAVCRYLEYNLGNPQIHGHIEAVHGEPPTMGRLIFPMREKFGEITIEEIGELIRLAHERIGKYREEHPDLLFSEVTAALREKEEKTMEAQEDKDKKSEQEKLWYVFRLLDRFDERTKEIALGVADFIDCSVVLPKKPRLTADAAREEDIRVTDLKITSAEYALGVRETAWEVLRRVIEHSDLLDKEGRLTAPYLQFSLHGISAKEADFIIGGGLKDGRFLPCDPVVGRWIKERLEEKIKERKIIGEEGRLARVVIAIEGEEYCGSIVNCHYRCGDQKRHPGFGEMLQVVQVEMGRAVRKKHFPDLGEIYGGILDEFGGEFPDRESLKNYIATHQTKSDLNRKKGIVTLKVVSSPEIPQGQVGLPYVLRNALGVKKGDKVMIREGEYVVTSAPKALADKRALVVGEEGFLETVEIRKG